MKKMLMMALLSPVFAHANYPAEVAKITHTGGIEGFKFYSVKCTSGSLKNMHLMEADGVEVMLDEFNWGTTRMRSAEGISLEEAARRACLDVDY